MREADIRSFRLDESARHAAFTGRTRDWTLTYRLREGWFMLTSFLCALPEEPALRARLLDHAMRANARLSLVKFAANETALTLDCEYRAAHVDREVVAELTGFMLRTLNDVYPALFRIVTGDDVLAQLDYTQSTEEHSPSPVSLERPA